MSSKLVGDAISNDILPGVTMGVTVNVPSPKAFMSV